jgi:hypothetical protein
VIEPTVIECFTIKLGSLDIAVFIRVVMSFDSKHLAGIVARIELDGDFIKFRGRDLIERLFGTVS